MLLEMKRKALPFDEVKIRTVYIEENKSSHFRTVRDSWRIYKLILAHFFRYTLSSILSAVLDEGLFVLLTHLLHSSLTGFALTAVPTVGARAVSSLFNFYVNKKLVFQSHGATAKALMRYYLLAVPTVLAQMGLTHGIYLLFNITPAQTLLRAVIYGIVMAVLFLVSFLVQQRWVFTQKEK
jgi:dolichol-phosphate mannosyltransferase